MTWSIHQKFVVGDNFNIFWLFYWNTSFIHIEFNDKMLSLNCNSIRLGISSKIRFPSYIDILKGRLILHTIFAWYHNRNLFHIWGIKNNQFHKFR